MFPFGRGLRGLRRGVWVATLVLGALVCASVVGIQPAASQLQDNDKQVRICHASASRTNPYVSNTPAIENNGDLHGGHLNDTGPVFPAPKWGDIIPPYDYVDVGGKPQVFPGSNWTPEGQAIWQNGCNAGLDPVTPILECVSVASGGGFLAHFGYDNPNSTDIVAPSENVLTPGAANGGQPSVFQPGRVKDAFQVESTDGGAITWTLTGTKITAAAGSPSCQGSITVDKALNPSDDPGRFNLEIGGETAGGAKAVGGGGTTGTIAVSAGSHAVGESAAAGTTLSDYVAHIVCTTAGTVVKEATATTASVPVRNGDDVVCTITNTRKAQLKPLVPVLECVVFRAGAPQQAVWGYRNDNDFAVTTIGATNSFAPAPEDRGQPTTFEPGTWTGVFDTLFGSETTLTWTLAGQSASASTSSPHCTSSIELRKVVVPAGDPGVFNLVLNGQVLATGGDGTTAGPYTIGVGEGTVSETAAAGTNLADYESTVKCWRNGTLEVSTPGTSVDGEVANGDFVSCTFTNRRLPTTGPLPPLPPDPPLPLPPTTPPDPPPGQPAPQPPSARVDLAVTKTAKPTTAVLGQNITWTVTVTNASPVPASDVNVVKVSERSYRTKLISVTPSQGTCTLTECNLGRLAPGASATITAVTKATQVGEIVNVVRVGSEEQEADYLNNTASNIVRVVDPFRPPQDTVVCRTLGAAPTVLRPGTTSIVLVKARSRFGTAVAGVVVHASGPGVRGQAKTDVRGIAHFTVTPTRAGFVAFRGALRTPAARGPVCATFLAAVAGGGVAGSVTG